MTDTIKILTAITRAPITPEKIFEALGGKPSGFYDTLEALERFELIVINRLHPKHHATLTVYLTDLGAERVIEALLGASQELPPGLVKEKKVRKKRQPRGTWDDIQTRLRPNYGEGQSEGRRPRALRERLR